ncbi:MAG: hypothetical protein WBY22_04950 [Nitrososphaeraceae archaeon]|jgi:hypothetical protein
MSLIVTAERKLLVFAILDEDMNSSVKCAECGCYPQDCKKSNSPETCPRCAWYSCCCWTTYHENPSDL